MKALYCMHCGSISSPPPDGRWRTCDCQGCAIRWRDPALGHAEVWTSLDPRKYVRVIGLNNLVLTMDADAVQRITETENDEAWRQVHETSTELVSPDYWYHRNRRNCWAVIFIPGDQLGDVKLVQGPDLPEGADG